MAVLEIVLITVFANAVGGLLLFELAWHQMKAIREVDEVRDSKYPAFRRWDAFKWRKWMFYPGAVTIMPIRIVLIVVVAILAYVFVRLGTLGHNFEKGGPIRGRFRNLVLTYTYKFLVSLVLGISGV